jgi:hypothetical protein
VAAAIDQKVVGLNRSFAEFYRGVIIERLPETADELRAVAADLGASSEDIKLGDAASVAIVKHMPLDNYRVVYFATPHLSLGRLKNLPRQRRSRLLYSPFLTSPPTKMMGC